MNWLLTFLLNALAVVLADRLLANIHISGIVPALMAGAALGIVNTFLRPILMLLTFPLTLFSLGLFIFIINAITFTIASWLVPGFDVLSFGGAFWGALITGIISWLLNLLFQERK
ncbi:phage holin family protein [Desulfoscipio gibsoniae]|uniref:Putative membrane protein n=1 Tax=Desulfoscipio gibsoniae DSM 7213 TaxID=767817 RepID=R4KR70_9FIRM|nr:phage holin family protein [Desulfoscipio gibsoniae]AGL03060.1 putative membrane protein [Desulfoscipio gibsoniae DSM 7213]